MSLNPAGQSAKQAIIDLANIIHPKMDGTQKFSVAAYADQIVENLVMSANAKQVAQVINSTASPGMDDVSDLGHT